MTTRASTVTIFCLAVGCLSAGCESCGGMENDITTLAVAQNHRVREIVCHGYGGQPAGVAEIDIFRSEHSVDVRMTPLSGHSIVCAAVCVSTTSDDPGDCDAWRRAGRLDDGSFSLNVPETAYDPQLCTELCHVHVRLRVSYQGSCDA